MAYLLTVLIKVDLQVVAEEVVVANSDGDTIMILKKKIMEGENHGEEDVKELANLLLLNK